MSLLHPRELGQFYIKNVMVGRGERPYLPRCALCVDRFHVAYISANWHKL